MLLFKDLKQGYPVYVLHKDNGLRVTVGKVTYVSPPRFAKNPSNLQQIPMELDVSIEDEGRTRTYVVPDSLSATLAETGVLIFTEREGLIKEVEAIKSNAEDELAKREMRESIVKDCDSILVEWNPALKEKKETEERLSGLESSISDVRGSVSKIEGMISSLMKELKG